MSWAALHDSLALARDSVASGRTYHAPALLELVCVLAAVAVLFARLTMRTDPKREDW